MVDWTQFKNPKSERKNTGRIKFEVEVVRKLLEQSKERIVELRMVERELRKQFGYRYTSELRTRLHNLKRSKRNVKWTGKWGIYIVELDDGTKLMTDETRKDDIKQGLEQKVIAYVCGV